MALLPEAKNCDVSVKRNFQLISSKLGYNSSPTYTNITLTDLTASSLVGTNASKLLESVTVGTGLDYTRPNLTLSHLGIEALTDPGGDRILFWDDVGTAACEWLSVGPSIAITTTNLDTIQDIQTSASPAFAGLHINSAEVTSTTLLTLESDISNNNEYNEILFKVVDGQNYGAIRSCVGAIGGDSYMSFFTTTNSGTLVRQVTIQHNGKVGLGTYNPETLLTMVSVAPYLTLYNVTEEDTDGGGESRLIHKREDGAGTGTACFQFEASHDGVVANDQLGRGVWSVNTGAGLAEAMRLNSNIRLGIGVGSGLDPRSGLTVSGDIDILHTAIEADDHAFEIDVDAAGYGDVKAIDINYTTGAIATGEDEGIILINIDEIQATGGDIFGLEILTTEGAAGSTTAVYGLKAGVLVNPVHQDSGTFANPTTGTDNTISTNVPYMIDGIIGNTTSIFEALNEYIIIGAAAVFEEIEFIVTTGASGAGIKPTFWYSTAGSHLFTQFTPVDGTNAFRNTGVVAWDASDLTSHGVNTDTGTYDIKIIRTRSSLTTSPILGFAKVAATTEYIWDKSGNVNINSLTLATVAAEGSDVDKFLVDSSGVVKYRTGVQVLSDIGGQASDAGLTSLAGLVYASDSFIKVTATDTYAIRTITETKTDLSLNLVENTALSTWAGTTNITTVGSISGNGTAAFEGASVTIGKASTTTGTIILHDSNSANTITLTVPDISAGSLSFTLPPTDGDNTNVLQTDGNGVLTWVAAGAGTDEKVKIDVGATAGYLGAASNDGVLRTGAGFSYADGGNFITLAVDGVLEDLDTLGANVADGEFIVGTAGGVLDWESGDTVRASIGLGFVDRGDPATDDFVTTDFTRDGTWYDLDLSGIVPAGAVAVLLSAYITDDAANSRLNFRKNGNSNLINVSTFMVQVGGVYFFNDNITACDSDRKVEYRVISTTGTDIAVTVKGWWLGTVV